MDPPARAQFGAFFAATLLWLSVATPRKRSIMADQELLARDLVCRDLQRNLTVAAGQVAPLAGGQCGRLLCDAGALGPRLVRQECEGVLDRSCTAAPGMPTEPYPLCCDQITCAGHTLHHGKCLNSLLQPAYEKGAAYPLESGECGYMECKGYFFDSSARRPSWRFQTHSCGKLIPSSADCKIVPGNEGGPFPTCCPKLVCITGRRTQDNEKNAKGGDKRGDSGAARDVSFRIAQLETTTTAGSADANEKVLSGNETQS